MVSIGMCVAVGVIAFIVGSLSGVFMMCLCVVGGSSDESGADCDIEERNKPGRGYRCKYCDRILSDLRYEAERKKR